MRGHVRTVCDLGMGRLCGSREAALVSLRTSTVMAGKTPEPVSTYFAGEPRPSGAYGPRTKDGNLSLLQASFPRSREGDGSLSPNLHSATNCIHLLALFIIPALIHFYFTLSFIHH